ncbi:MAG TPA: Sec-independent protein translocase TatB [Microbacterium sp.]|uniref:Sec-independent protein translocase TatB n=1 Tax=Microbacterium sp. TaxID=51671 RepID=UPI002B472596|nr:Sec-independent protein translocase TatB [Microbacterium sp.]HKT55745.1 Sec-independent protein translocase TatB [Microbacterium sp.]
MILGLTIEKLIVIGLIAAMLLGPERLPKYAALLAQFTVRAREFVNGAKDRMREEMGDEFDDVDWRKLDPRQYDPRRIIREALLDDAPIAASSAFAPTPAIDEPAAEDAADAGTTSRTAFEPGRVPPFDLEAT